MFFAESKNISVNLQPTTKKMFYDKSPLYTKPSLALASPPSRFLLFFLH
ncbi:putative glycosyltransferase domain protein [Bacteroides fragilis str. 1007-1-F |uniref:Glycosyltransferase domain protein n=1 Tax=Bacteroides fragilis str. 1007-1-F \|nr:hypothetical protein M117_3164 [Bacteroides fragilis str. 3774 T13]EXY45422.1 putative glycosyltransferase domain protein [Bacteroides fragilis str. 3783N1-2]EYA13595.1 putative glycosyltransferase domain protein [Bacteroides fragilis str. 1007-1-F \